MAEFVDDASANVEDTKAAPERGPAKAQAIAEGERAKAESEWEKRLATEWKDEEAESAERIKSLLEKEDEEDAPKADPEPEAEEPEAGDTESEDEEPEAPSDAAVANAKRALGKLGFPKARIDKMAGSDPSGLVSWAEDAKAVLATQESTWQENQRLKREAASGDDQGPGANAQPAQTPTIDAKMLAKPLAEELGLDEKSSQKVADTLAKMVQAATAPLAEKLQSIESEGVQREGARNREILTESRKAYSKQYPELAFDETYEVVHERMVDLSRSGKYDPASDKDVKRLMRDAIKLEDLQRVDNASGEKARGERDKRRNGQPTTSGKRTRGAPRTQAERERAAFDLLEGGSDVSEAFKAMGRK